MNPRPEASSSGSSSAWVRGVSGQRFLRPGALVPVAGRLWVVDEFQPVAAVLDPASGALEQVVSWPQLPPPPATFAPYLDGWRILGGAERLWVQPYPGGPVAGIDPGGLVQAGYSAGRRLAAVTDSGAWCRTPPAPQGLPGSPEAPGTPVASDCLQLVRPNGATVRVAVERPVCELRSGAAGLYVRLADAEEGCHPRETDPVWLRLPAQAPVPDQLTVAQHATTTPPPPRTMLLHGNPGRGGPWHSAPLSGDAGPLVAGKRWKVGCAREHPRERQLVATAHAGDAHERTEDTEQYRVGLGPGTALALAADADSLWIAARRGRTLSPGLEGPVELLRITAATAHVETVLTPDSIEITDRCWPLPAAPIEADSYAEHQRATLTGLDDSDRFSSATPVLMGAGIRDSRVELVGSWPQTAVQLSFAYDPLPGLRLVRTLAIYDELGRRRPLPYAGIHLLEDLDTGQLPPSQPRPKRRPGNLEAVWLSPSCWEDVLLPDTGLRTDADRPVVSSCSAPRRASR